MQYPEHLSQKLFGCMDMYNVDEIALLKSKERNYCYIEQLDQVYYDNVFVHAIMRSCRLEQKTIKGLNMGALLLGDIM